MTLKVGHKQAALLCLITHWNRRELTSVDSRKTTESRGVARLINSILFGNVALTTRCIQNKNV